MADIILTTLNARYWHSSFGLRYLLANMGELKQRTQMFEFGIGDRTVDILAAILQQQPRIVGIGVYIWNVEPATKLVQDLKHLRPDIVVVIGGPEVSYETDCQAIVDVADYVITGEADRAWPELCRKLLTAPVVESPSSGADLTILTASQTSKIIHSEVPLLADVSLPYELYTDEDIANRVIYVEVSRGCPFTCDFCLSALDIPVRLFDLDTFFAAMQNLLDRGARQFKFVDRTFNLNMRVSSGILQFFLDRYEPGLFLHFEMIPDRLPDTLRELIMQFPDGVLQFEIGVQTFNDEVGELISRRQDNAKLANNFRFLREQTGVHIHADLIVGLPGETIDSFADGFDRLVQLQPQEIQVGILKRLKGTPITRHDEAWEMTYSAHPPFEILSNKLIDFGTLHRLRRFARYWDLVANSGNFVVSTPLIWASDSSPFWRFLEFSDWLYEVEQRAHGVPLARLAKRLFEFLSKALSAQEVALSVWQDYVRGGRRDKPPFLKPFELPPAHHFDTSAADLPGRQARHVQD